MENEPKTEFTQEELKLICRALNFYVSHPEYMSDDRFEFEPLNAQTLATRIYRQNFRL